MSYPVPNVDGIKRQAKQTLHQASPWLVRLARLGYAAKGVLYLIIGIFAAQAARAHGQSATNTQGALQVILGEPFGRFLLGIVAVGLFSHAAWRLVEAALDPEGAGSDAKGITARFGFAVSGLIYAGLAVTATRLLLGWSVDHGNWAQAEVARLLEAHWGQVIVGVFGGLILGVAFYSFYAAYAAPFRENMDIGKLSEAQRRWVTGLGRAGNAARGVVFGIVAVYLFQAAMTADSHHVRGMQGAQQSLIQQPGGVWLLGIVAAGLIAYGLFMFVEARFHRLGKNV